MTPKVNFLSILLKNEPKTGKKSINPHISYGKDMEDLGNPMFVDIFATIRVPSSIDPSLYRLMSDKARSKYIKIKIVQSTNASITKQISNQPYKWLSQDGLLDSYHSNDLSFVIRDLKDYEGSQIAKSLEEIGNVVEVKQDSRGRKIHFFPYKFSFEIPEECGGEKVEHLAYFAFAYIDLKSLSQDKQFDASRLIQNENFLKNTIGAVSKQVVIQGRRTKNTNQVFHVVGKKDSIWTGGVHYHGPENPGPSGYIGYMANHSDGTMGPKLKLASVPNNIVQDYRKQHDIKKINFDFSLFPEKKETKFTSGSKKKSIFGEIYTSIDKSNNIKYAFSFDKKQAIMQNTSFPSLAEKIFNNGTPEDVSEILNKQIIKDFKIYRNRVYDHSHVQRTSDLSKNIKNDRAKPVILSAENNFGVLIGSTARTTQKSQDNFGGTIKEMSVDLQPMSVNSKKYIKFYTGMDFGIPKDGKYAYSVEITMKDAMLPWFESRVESLKAILYDKTSPDSNSYEEYMLATKKNKDFFNNLTNRFTQGGMKSIRQNFGTKFSYDKIVQFFQILDKFFLFKSSRNRTEIFMFLTTISSLQFGSPTGVETTFKIMEDLYKKILISLSSLKKYKKHIDSLHVESKHSAGSNAVREYTIRHRFKSEINGKINNLNGYDYLANPMLEAESQDLSTGLKTLSANQYKNRVEMETQKLFQGIDLAEIRRNLQIRSHDQVLNPRDSVGFTKYAYLSPSVVNLDGVSPQNLLNNGRMNSNVQEMNNVLLNIIRKKTEHMQVVDTNIVDQRKKGKNKDKILKKHENIEMKYDLVSLASFNQVSIKTKNGEEIENSNIDPTSLLLAAFQQKYFNYLSDSTWDSDYYTNPKEINKEFLNWSRSNRSDKSYKSVNSPLKRAPNHVKALMMQLNHNIQIKNRSFDSLANTLQDTKPETYKYDMSQESSSTQNASNFFEHHGKLISKNKILYQTPEFLAFFMLNYKKIVKVEYLYGYFRGDINNPIWNEITSLSWNAMTRRGGNFICRMVPYYNELYGVKEYDLLNLPIYNEYFAINFPSVQQGNASRAAQAAAGGARQRLPAFNPQRAENINEPMVKYGFSDSAMGNAATPRIGTSSSARATRTSGNMRGVNTPRETTSGMQNRTSTTGTGNRSTY